MTAMNKPAATFDDHLASEIIASERMRMAILAALLGLLIAVFSVLHALYGNDPGPGLPDVAHRRIVIGMALLLAYELFVRHMVGRRAAQGKAVPAALRYLNALVEISAPSAAILMVSRHVEPLYVLHSAASFFYAVFIVLSTLRLDFRLSVFTGLVAAAQYMLLCLVHPGVGELGSGTPFAVAPYHLAKGAMLVLAGLAAGFVAHQLKRRIGNAYRNLIEQQRVLDLFGQQLAPAVVEELLKAGPQAGSGKRFVCVMFMDVRDFTPMAEGMRPEQIVEFQNQVFGEAAEVVNRHHGIVNQFLGDGFMATFGAPVATGRDCANAMAAAQDLLIAIDGLAAAGRIPRIRIGVGLHAGEAVAGNIGSRQRKQYSVTGNVVVLASRIEQLNKRFGSQILVSSEVLAAAAGEGALAPIAQALGAVHVKGREAPVEIHRLA